METYILMLFEKLGASAVFLLILVENLFPPIPSELVLTLAGYLSQITAISPLIMIIYATCGSVIGACILYALGYYFSYERLCRILHLPPSEAQSAFMWYEKYQTSAVFFGRLIPIVRSLISIPAGLAKMSLYKFIITTTLGSLIWNSILITAGYILGENHQIIIQMIDNYKYLLIICLLIVTILLVLKKALKK